MTVLVPAGGAAQHMAPPQAWTFGDAQVQVPLVQVGVPPLQSLLVQHAALAMHAVPHVLKPVAQGKLHVLALPQTPTVFAAVGVQLALVQQPALGTHSVVPGQFL